MKKFFASLLIVLSIFGSAFAHGGLMSGEEDIRVTKTKWFDIIYPARSEKAAILLYENADRIYEEIGESYGFPPQFRLPVVICPGVEQFNGYMSNGYYNHIVLYDTAMIDELAVFTDTFLNLFKHECIHAYTFNLKNKFWTIVGKVLGDALSPNVLITTSGLAEGATVSGESALGEGRLNNEYTTQMIKQAKIEGDFPSFYDAQGASDTYPVGSFYFFNGAFDSWLQEKYGMEKYAKFWYRCVNVQTISQTKAFKRIYGMKLGDAWKLFSEEYKVPDVVSNPVASGQVQDFFEPENKYYSSSNNAGALYTKMTASDNGIAYLDDSCSKVFYVPFSALTQEEIEPEKLFTMSYIFDLKFSKDGKYLATSVYDYTTSNVRTVTKIYDMESGKFFKFDDHGFYEPLVFKSNGEYYVARKGFVTPQYTIEVSKLSFNEKGKIVSASDFVSKTLPLNIVPFSFTELGDGTFAYIKKAGLDFSIEICDASLNVIKSFEAPKDKMVIRYLSTAADDKLLFSWTAPGTMPRLGSLSLATGTFELQEDDISGGVYYPVETPSGDLAYIGQFYRQNRMFTAEDTNLSEIYTTIPAGGGAEPVDGEEQVASEEQVGIQPQATSIPSEKYSPFPYFTRGMFLPVSLLTTTSYSPDFRGSYSLDYGISYITNDPWDSLTLELDAGYGMSSNTGALMLTAVGTNGTGTNTYNLQGEVEFNNKGWKKVNAYASDAYQYPVGNGWLICQAVTQLNFGKTDKAIASTGDELQDLLLTYTFGSAVSDDRNNYSYWTNALIFCYTNIRQFTSNKFEKGGFSLAVNPYYTLWNNATTGELYYNGMDLEMYTKIYAPKLLPFNCSIGKSYNLPTYFMIDIFPSNIQNAFITVGNYSWASTEFNSTLPFASAGFATLLYASNIQKTTFARWLYIRDFQITMSYTGLILEKEASYSTWRIAHMGEYFNKMKNNSMHYEDYFGLRFGLSFCPNIGRLASYSSEYQLFFEYGFSGLFGKQNQVNPKITFGFGSSLF